MDEICIIQKRKEEYLDSDRPTTCEGATQPYFFSSLCRSSCSPNPFFLSLVAFLCHFTHYLFITYPTPIMNARKTQNLSEAKLNRLLEYNQRLKELLDIPRTTVSEASTR